MNYPEYANIKGTRYKLKTDYRVALRCFEVVNDPDISGEERSLAVIYLLFGFVPESDLKLFLEKATLFLQCGQTREQQTTQKADMDFFYDRKYINASFMSDYQINLNRAEMHWWQFVELIQGLTEDCALSRIRELRNIDPNDYKDAKTRERIVRAQEAVAIPIRHSQEELDAMNEFEKLFKEV